MLKEINIDPGDNTPSNDSAWYVSSVNRIDYDTLGVIIDSSADHISYLTGKNVYKHVSNEFGPLDSFQYTYYYDQNNRLTKFDLDYNTNPIDDDVKTISFTYTGNSAAQTDITLWNGTIDREYIAYSNGNKTITVYDTVPATYEKTMITSFYLGVENRIDSVREIWKMSVSPFYTDTTFTRFSYDAQNNATRMHDNAFIEHFLPSGGGYVIDGFDSIVVQSRETRGAEVANTWNKVLSNMSWYPTLSIESLFNMSDNPITYSHYPVISAKRWTRYFSSFSTIDPILYNGNFVNIFNSDNLLIQQQLPLGFSNKYGGRASMTFSYIKLPK